MQRTEDMPVAASCIEPDDATLETIRALAYPALIPGPFKEDTPLLVGFGRNVISSIDSTRAMSGNVTPTLGGMYSPINVPY
jgi:hypothetical protein